MGPHELPRGWVRGGLCVDLKISFKNGKESVTPQIRVIRKTKKIETRVNSESNGVYWRIRLGKKRQLPYGGSVEKGALARVKTFRKRR